MCACFLSCFKIVLLFMTPWTVAHQVPLSMGFSRQEYQSGLPCPPPGDLPDPGSELVFPVSPALWADSFTVEYLTPNRMRMILFPYLKKKNNKQF